MRASGKFLRGKTNLYSSSNCIALEFMRKLPSRNEDTKTDKVPLGRRVTAYACFELN